MRRKDISRGRRGPGTVAVSGNSMAPTYEDGDWLLVLWGSTARVGKIAVIERENRPGIYLIKRVLRAEASHYWVEGDNKEESNDSRQWGGISAEEIVGRVLLRYKKGRRGN